MKVDFHVPFKITTLHMENSYPIVVVVVVVVVDISFFSPLFLKYFTKQRFSV